MDINTFATGGVQGAGGFYGGGLSGQRFDRKLRKTFTINCRGEKNFQMKVNLNVAHLTEIISFFSHSNNFHSKARRDCKSNLLGELRRSKIINFWDGLFKSSSYCENIL